MKHTIPTLLLLLTLTACAGLGPGAVQPGQTESEVIARLGAPTNRYPDGAGRVLEYRTGYWGRETYMARVGPDNRLISFEQVLTDQKFGQIAMGQARKDDVLRLVGAPAETSYLPRKDLEVWSYPYKQSGVWNNTMHVHFDRAGIARELVTVPDLPRDGFFSRFGLFGM